VSTEFLDLHGRFAEVRGYRGHAPASPVQSGDVGSIGIGTDSGADFRNRRSVTVYLQRGIASDNDPESAFEVEFKVLNTEELSQKVPSSPHLSDLPFDQNA